MAAIDIRNHRIDAKIVYYGPAQSGKTTNLTNVHSRLPQESRGPLRSIDTVDERTLFFDLMPIQDIEVGGWTIRFHLYTVPGQADYVRTRRAILGGADGVVFVADADPARQQENEQSMAELRQHLEHYAKDVAAVPLVLQVNKTDLPNALSTTTVADPLNLHAWPVVQAMAIRGIGVSETLATIARAVARTL